MQPDTFPSPELLGQFHQFGELGPTYKIINPIRRLEKDDWLLLIQVTETGEKVEYRYSKVKEDPKVH